MWCSTELASTRSGRESRSSRRRGGVRAHHRPWAEAGRPAHRRRWPGCSSPMGCRRADPDHDKPSLIRPAALDDALTSTGDSLRGPRVTNIRLPRSAAARGSGTPAPEVTNFDDVEPDPGHVLVVDIDESDRDILSPSTPVASAAGGSLRCTTRSTGHRRPGPEPDLDDRTRTAPCRCGWP